MATNGSASRYPETEGITRIPSNPNVVTQGHSGEIPVLNAPDLFGSDEAANNQNVESKTSCTISKSKLDFGLTGQTLHVTPLGQSEPFVSETITLKSNRGDYVWQLVQSCASEKFRVEASQTSGKIRAKRSTDITIKFRIYCTAKLVVKLGIMLAPKSSGIFPFFRKGNNTSKSSITTTQDVMILSFRAESDLSACIDYEELEIEKKIASGGFGTVFKAKWRTLDVAVKKLHVQDLTPEDKEVFLREIKLMRMLTCQYVVTLMGSTQIPGQPLCLVMEYIPKGALTNMLRQPVSRTLKCKIGLDIARGMNFLHSNNIFHRDLKPDNVLVISDSEDAVVNIKITDFDTARTYLQDSHDYNKNYQSFVQAAKQAQQQQQQHDVRTISNMGTLIYKAPELMGGNKVDPNFINKTDVFSFGVLMYHVYTQKEPYSEAPHDKFTGREIENFVKSGQRLQIPPTVESPIAKLIDDCWQQRARQRPDMESIVNILQRIHSTFGSSEPRASSAPQLDFVPPLDIHSKIGWAGIIERDIAVQKLESCVKGTFLIRWSARAKSYVMTLKGPKGVEHIADIRPNPATKGITVVKQNGEKREFTDLVAYVEAMKRQKVIDKPLALECMEVDQTYDRTPNYYLPPIHVEAEDNNDI